MGGLVSQRTVLFGSITCLAVSSLGTPDMGRGGLQIRRIGTGLEGSTRHSLVSTRKRPEGLSPEPNPRWIISSGYDPALFCFPVCVGAFLSGMGGCLISKMI